MLSPLPGRILDDTELGPELRRIAWDYCGPPGVPVPPDPELWESTLAMLRKQLGLRYGAPLPSDQDACDAARRILHKHLGLRQCESLSRFLIEAGQWLRPRSRRGKKRQTRISRADRWRMARVSWREIYKRLGGNLTQQQQTNLRQAVRQRRLRRRQARGHKFIS